MSGMTEQELAAFPVVDADDTPEAYTYLSQQRQLTDETIAAYDLRADVLNECVLLPVRDSEGDLIWGLMRSYGVTRRKFRNHTRTDATILVGEDVVVTGGTGILVRGVFDMLRLHSLGYTNVVANQGAALLGAAGYDEKLTKLTSWFTDLVVCMDGVQRFQDAAQAAVDSISVTIPATRVEPAAGQAPASMTDSEIDALLGAYKP